MENFESTRETIKWLLATAWLLPLLGFAIEIFGGWWGHRKSRVAAYMAVACIGTGFVCSVAAYLAWSDATEWPLRHAIARSQALAAEDFVHSDRNHDLELSAAELHHFSEHHAIGDLKGESLGELIEELAHEEHEHEPGHDHDHEHHEHQLSRDRFEAAVAAIRLSGELIQQKGEEEDSTKLFREEDLPASLSIDFAAADVIDTPGGLTQTELATALVPVVSLHHGHDEHHDEEAAAVAGVANEEGHDHDEEHGEEHSEYRPIKAFAGSLYKLGTFGSLTVSLDYYVDSLTLVMFMMVTLIATCIHCFAIGYMSDELTEEYVDHHAHTADGHHVHRPGRFYRFFAFLSLFCFSMLGLVFAGNIFQVFVFWELVGICSYLLIGFYTERRSANVAANKAFIMNRVGDFGFLIGLMVIWTWFGNFQFVEMDDHGQVTGGIFQMLRGSDGVLHTSVAEDGTASVMLHDGDEERSMPYSLLVVLGLGIFAGCIGKSAQFPLQTWLPDAMEGPTPVSALVHSATMVAAGVYLVGRFYPMFTPEVLLTIAYIGCITLFVAATIAVVATDLKKVLAYSTISQLGYMMLGLGVFGWGAGLFHLITHAFFKSLMFLASGSVICGCHHEQEMPRMGGLLKKMPITALTMLVGVIAISGLAIPGTAVAFSGFYSKDAIVATALTFSKLNGLHFLLFFVPLVTAGITAFYMFRLWFYTFWGKPRDQELHDHVHESPWVMTGPLLVLSLFAAFCAVGGEHGSLFLSLTDSQPEHVSAIHTPQTAELSGITLFGHHQVLENHASAGQMALMAAVIGTFLAFMLYGLKVIDPADIRDNVTGVYQFLVNKWQFDELYDAMFVRPSHIVATWCTWVDRNVFDAVLHGACRVCIAVSVLDRRIDEKLVDGLVNLIGSAVMSVGTSLRAVQTGKLRQYVMFIAVGVMAVFVVVFVCLPK